MFTVDHGHSSTIEATAWWHITQCSSRFTGSRCCLAKGVYTCGNNDVLLQTCMRHADYGTALWTFAKPAHCVVYLFWGRIKVFFVWSVLQNRPYVWCIVHDEGSYSEEELKRWRWVLNFSDDCMHTSLSQTPGGSLGRRPQVVVHLLCKW